MRKRFLIVFALLLAVCVGIFAFSACRKTTVESSDEEAAAPAVQVQEEQPANDTPEPVVSQENDPLPDPEQEPSPEENPETPDQTEKPSQPAPASPKPIKDNPESNPEVNPEVHSEDNQEDNPEIVGESAKDIDPNVDWEHGWQP